jgi:hypothetical protein
MSSTNNIYQKLSNELGKKIYLVNVAVNAAMITSTSKFVQLQSTI